MIFAGVDVGSMSAEAVLFDGEKIRAHSTIVVKPNPLQSATIVMDTVLEESGLTYDDITYCVSTGYGRERIPFAQHDVSEISCHGKGAVWAAPTVRTVIDIGGQDSKVIRVDENGDMQDFVMNDKCAAGTGRFLEGIARTFHLHVSDLGQLALEGTDPAPINSLCTVFANFDVMCMLAEGQTKENIAFGVSNVLARRVFSLVSRVGLVQDICVTGGVAKNQGVVRSLAHVMEVPIQKLPVDSQIVGALGAALFACRRYERLRMEEKNLAN
ncbi:MAG: 2-hydroxyglutaryl-CoA dehydratase [Desulfatitalea sp.]|nr:2-hydroxyglutaryl-CoA dehydratase [Desulfatitalea sp.]NNK01199.1 2-hydroxyglutaryl-CoA dehydratase [Desulfatitalea sp.]